MQTVSVWQGRRESRPQGWATILRGSWRRLLSLSLLWGALLLRPDSTLGDDGRTVTDVRVGTDDGRLVIELGASGPLRNYALAEEADPFTLILYLPNTTLAFPATPRRLEAGSLREVIPETFEHAGRPLSQLAFVFAHQATYRVRADGPRLFLRVDLDGVPDTMLLGSETAPPAPSTSTPEETASKQTAVESAPSAPGAPLALAETSEASSPPATASNQPLTTAMSAPAPPERGEETPTAALPPVIPGDTPATPSPSTPHDQTVAESLPPTAAAPAVTETSEASSRPATAADQPLTVAAPAPARPESRTGQPSIPTGPVTPGPVRATRIHRLTVLEAGTGAARVTVDADGALTYRVFTLPKPLRLIVDFDDVAYGLARATFPAHGPLLSGIRASHFRVAPTSVVRIVFDLTRMTPYWIEPQARAVVVHIGARPLSP